MAPLPRMGCRTRLLLSDLECNVFCCLRLLPPDFPELQASLLQQTDKQLTDKAIGGCKILEGTEKEIELGTDIYYLVAQMSGSKYLESPISECSCQLDFFYHVHMAMESE